MTTHHKLQRPSKPHHRVLFFSCLRAARRQLPATDLPCGGSEGFNQCAADLVEARGESAPAADSASTTTDVRLSRVHSSCLNTGAFGSLQVSEPTSEVPDHIRPNHLIKELTKEIRHLEVRRQSLAAF